MINKLIRKTIGRVNKDFKYDHYFVGYDATTKKYTLIDVDDPQVGLTVIPTNTVALPDIMSALNELLRNEEPYPDIAISTWLYDNLPCVSVKISIPNF